MIFIIWLLLLSCWIPFSLGQTCTSTGGDGNSSCSTNPRHLPCRAAHSDQNFFLCNNVKDLEIDDIIFLERCPYLQHCHVLTSSVDVQNSKVELMPIELYAVDIRFFAIHVSWHHPVKFSVGYEITILKGRDILHCICINGIDQRSVYIRGSQVPFFKLVYGESSGTSLTVEIFPIQRKGQEVKRRLTVQWPTSCLDVSYNKHTCGSPVFQPPSNITAIEVCDSLSNFTVDLWWDYAILMFPPPSLYYIDVFSKEKTDDLYPLFRFVASGTTSVRIQLPNGSLNYNFTVQPYGNCSGIANFTNNKANNIGCGRRSENIPLHSCINTSPTTTTTIIASTLVNSTIKEANYLIVRVCSAESAVLLFVVLVVFFSCIAWRKMGKKPVLVRRRLTPSPIAFSVFVVHSPTADIMRDIQTYVVCPLQEFFDVATSGDKMYGDIIEWIEIQVRESNAVLLVITKEFFSEWEEYSSKSNVVRAIQRLLTSAVSQNILDKYAIIVLDDEVKENYIPNNHYLKSLSVYVLGKKKNEIDSLCRFVTKTSPFEHGRRASCSSISSNSLSDLDMLSASLNPIHTLSSPCDLPSKHRKDLYSRTDITQLVSPDAPPEQFSNNFRVGSFQSERNITQQLLKVFDQPMLSP